MRYLHSRIHSQGLKRSKNHPDSRAIFFEDEKYNKRKVEDFLAALNGFKATMQIMKTFKGRMLNNVLFLFSLVFISLSL